MLYGPGLQGGGLHRIIGTTILNECRRIRLAVVRRAIGPQGENRPARQAIERIS